MSAPCEVCGRQACAACMDNSDAVDSAECWSLGYAREKARTDAAEADAADLKAIVEAYKSEVKGRELLREIDKEERVRAAAPCPGCVCADTEHRYCPICADAIAEREAVLARVLDVAEKRGVEPAVIESMRTIAGGT